MLSTDTISDAIEEYGIRLLPNDLIDSRTANIDTWTEFDGTLAEDVNAKLLVATTQLNTTSTFNATYGQSGTTITITTRVKDSTETQFNLSNTVIVE